MWEAISSLFGRASETLGIQLPEVPDAAEATDAASSAVDGQFGELGDVADLAADPLESIADVGDTVTGTVDETAASLPDLTPDQPNQ